MWKAEKIPRCCSHAVPCVTSQILNLQQLLCVTSVNTCFLICPELSGTCESAKLLCRNKFPSANRICYITQQQLNVSDSCRINRSRWWHHTRIVKPAADTSSNYVGLRQIRNFHCFCLIWCWPSRFSRFSSQTRRQTERLRLSLSGSFYIRLKS